VSVARELLINSCLGYCRDPALAHYGSIERAAMIVKRSENCLGQIGQVSLCVRDLERATAFYRDVLGMRHLLAGPKMSFFDCGGVRLVLGVKESASPEQSSSILYFKVEDIQSAYDRLSTRGVRFENEPMRLANMASFDLWMAFFRDSEGNLMGLMCEVPKRKAA
jgi:methylmalonyl-CoA/ethylmalonyl-CoA epimerase